MKNYENEKPKFFALATSAIIMVAPAMVLAAPIQLEDCNSLLTFITNTLGNTLAAFIGAIAVIMLLIGAFQFLTAGGDTQKVKDARSTILWAIVGFAVALVASKVDDIVISIIGGGPLTCPGDTPFIPVP